MNMNIVKRVGAYVGAVASGLGLILLGGPVPMLLF